MKKKEGWVENRRKDENPSFCFGDVISIGEREEIVNFFGLRGRRTKSRKFYFHPRNRADPLETSSSSSSSSSKVPDNPPRIPRFPRLSKSCLTRAIQNVQFEYKFGTRYNKVCQL